MSEPRDDALRRSEAEASLAFAERADRAVLGGEDPIPWLDRLESLYEELHAALDWFHEHGDANSELRLAATLGLFWRVRGRIGEGLELLERALRQPVPQAPRVRARALSAAGRLAYRQGDFERARQLYEESLRTSYAVSGSSWSVGQSLSDLGGVARAEGDHERAEAFFHEAADVLRAAGHRVRLGTVLGNLADVRLARGDAAEAARLAREALALQEETGDADGRVFTLVTLGRIAAHEGREREAESWLQRGFALAEVLDDREVHGYLLLASAEAAWLRGDADRAVELVEAADAALAEVGIVRLSEDDRRIREQILARADRR